MLKFGNKEFRNIQEQVEKNAKDIEKLIEEGVPGGGTGESGLPTDKPTDNGQILIGYTDGSVEWSTETIREFQHELVSGENIKTINGNSILGSGNLQIGEGGTVYVDNVVEFDTISSLPTSPTAVDSVTMEKLKNPGTVIKYGREVYAYNSYNSNDNTIHYLNIYNIVNSSLGEVNLTFRSLYVITETSTYYPNTGVFYRIDNAFNIPQKLGSSHTDDGDYIWVANKSGTTRTSSWQKYTPGTGGGGTGGDLSNYYTKSESDNRFAAKTTFDTTIMGINSVLEDIPTTYATNAGVAGLEATVRGEIETTNGRIDEIYSAEPLTGFPTQDFKIDSNGSYFKISNLTGSYEELAPEVVDLLTPDWNPDYANIYTFFKEQILRVTHAGGRGRIYVDPSWNTFGESGTNGNKLWLLCLNSGIEVGNFNEPLPKAFIVEYVNSVLTLEMILKNGTRAIMVINEDNGAYSSNGFQKIVYGGGSGGGITTQDPVTADGQILIGNLDGTYNWTTETFYEIANRISALETVVNNITYYEGETE